MLKKAFTSEQKTKKQNKNKNKKAFEAVIFVSINLHLSTASFKISWNTLQTTEWSKPKQFKKSFLSKNVKKYIF